MHNHKDKGDNKSSMMLWMILPCLLLLGVLFIGGGAGSPLGYFLPLLIVLFLLAHIWMMSKGHTGLSENTTDGAHTQKPKDIHS